MQGMQSGVQFIQWNAVYAVDIVDAKDAVNSVDRVDAVECSWTQSMLFTQ